MSITTDLHPFRRRTLRRASTLASGLLGVALIGCTPPGLPPLTDPPPASEPPSTAPGTTEPGTTVPGSTVPPLVRGAPTREWQFAEFRGDALERVDLDAGIQVGGVLHELFDFGKTSRDFNILDPDGTQVDSDGIATGQIASTAEGSTWWVGAEAPIENANLPDVPIGGYAELHQTQSFIKRSADATLSYTVSSIHLEATDENAVLGRLCPEIHADGLRCDLIKGEVFLAVEAFTVPAAPEITPFDYFYNAAGGATLNGYSDNWDGFTWTPRYSEAELWNIDDFEFVVDDLDGHADALVVMALAGPHTYTVDLSSVAVGQAFTLRSFATATAYNRISGPPSEFASSVSAFLRDPQEIGGSTISFDGLEAVDDLGVDPPADVPVEPAPCSTGTDPDAGTLHFSSEGFTISEANRTPTITVTRTGGSTGAVTATFSTADGSALAGTDYTPVNASVFFADGDDAPRVVEVPIVQDLIGGEPDATVIVTLSEPGGCATLGDPATALLTIRDDDPRPFVPESFGLDTTFGDEGEATSPGFGGDRSAMALQPDGKIVMVGGTFTDFVLARFNADGTLDGSFDGDGDSDGKIITDVGGGFAQEEAMAVAIQPDGKIVVAGYTDRTNVALVRYLPNGSVDTTFGSAGMVTSGVEGIANDVAIQPDGRIVIAGTRSLDDFDDFGDVVVARYLSNGTLDPSFGSGGQLTTDFAGTSNEGTNVVVQPDGAIVVSGSAPNPGGIGLDHTDIVRYLSDGRPDASFGTAGTVTLDDLSVGADLALQADGRLVLVGSVDVSIAPAPAATTTDFLVVRLDADGGFDDAFGDEGVVHVSPSTIRSELGTADRDAATSVAIQPDGRIVVAGNSSDSNQDFAVVRLDADGSTDTDFGIDGALIIDFFRFTDVAESVAIQPDGMIVIGGQARGDVDGYGLTRVLP